MLKNAPTTLIIHEPQQLSAQTKQLPLIERYCAVYGVDHLLKTCPYKFLRPLGHEPTKPKTHNSQPSTYTEITLIFATKMLSVYARLDSKTTHSMLSYEEWETLDS